MKSLRLQALASFVEFDAKVADIGCDHAYLSIYLAENKLCQKIIASDINKNALEIAKSNIKKKKLENVIKTFLSDGIKEIEDKDINTLIISGMGANTILKIMNNINEVPIKKLIIQSNNDLYQLRTKMPKYNFYLKKEKIIYENNHFYVIQVYSKERRKLKYKEKLFGFYNQKNIKYYEYIFQKLKNIDKKINFNKNFRRKIRIKLELFILKKYL